MQVLSAKACARCGEMKPVAEFSRNRTTRDGFQNRCKACVRAHYEANREAINERDRAYYEANREVVRERHRAYREANREADIRRSRAYYAANRERAAEYGRAYREANREVLLKRKRTYGAANREAAAWAQERFARVRREIAAAATARGEWLEGEQRFLVAHHLDWTYAEMAMALGRTVESVNHKVVQLRKKGLIA